MDQLIGWSVSAVMEAYKWWGQTENFFLQLLSFSFVYIYFFLFSTYSSIPHKNNALKKKKIITKETSIQRTHLIAEKKKLNHT